MWSWYPLTGFQYSCNIQYTPFTSYNLQCGVKSIDRGVQYARPPRPHTHNRHMPRCFNQLIFIKPNFLSVPRHFLHWFLHNFYGTGGPNIKLNWVPVVRTWKTHLSSCRSGGCFISQPFFSCDLDTRETRLNLLSFPILIPLEIITGSPSCQVY